MAKNLKINSPLISETIKTLKGIKTKMEENPVKVPEKQGSGETADMLEKTAQEYKKMYEAILDLNIQTITYLEAVKDSVKKLDKSVIDVWRREVER